MMPDSGTPPLVAHILDAGGRDNVFHCLNLSFVRYKRSVDPEKDGEGWVKCGSFYTRYSTVQDSEAELMVTFLAPSILLLNPPDDVIISLNLMSILGTTRFVEKMGLSLSVYECKLSNKQRTAVIFPGDDSMQGTLPGSNLAAYKRESSFEADPTVYEGVQRSAVTISIAQNTGALVLNDHLELVSEGMQKILEDKDVQPRIQQTTPSSFVLIFSENVKLPLSYPFPINESNALVRFSRKRFFIELTLCPSISIPTKFLYATEIHENPKGP